MKTKLAIVLSLTLVIRAYAGSATWNLNPTSGDWNTAANWNPATVPNGSGDTASFGVSNQPTVFLSADTEVYSIIYNAGASSYNTTVPTGISLTVFNGIANSSVMDQTFTIEGGGQLLFNRSFSARADDTFTLEGNGDGVFTIINLNGNGAGANCVFLGRSIIDYGPFNVNGADSAAHGPGVLTFAENSISLSNNLIIATGGSNGGAGGKIIFRDSAYCLPYLEIYGNASLDISGSTRLVSNVLSLKGDGIIFLGGRHLNYSGDIESIFPGIIQDGGVSGGSGGSLLLNGLGPLTLTGANTYSGGTTIDDRVFRKQAILNVSNRSGSGTGSGPVTVNQGILGGNGSISGAVTVAGVGPIQKGTLAPAAAGGKTASTLTIRNLLTFGANGVYSPLIQSKGQKVRTDRVIARGVTIGSGASFSLLADQLQSTLEVGTTLTLISNNAATPISGTFANLADGAVLTVNGNKLQANYEGGDGNDLTLTVVP